MITINTCSDLEPYRKDSHFLLEEDAVLGDFTIDSSLKSRGNLRFKNGFECGGRIETCEGIVAGRSITARGGIKADRGIVVGGGITSGTGIEGKWIEAGEEGIKAREGIKAVKHIETKGGIEAGWKIEAGEGIKAGSRIEAGMSHRNGTIKGRRIKAGSWIKTNGGVEAAHEITAQERIEAGYVFSFQYEIDAEIVKTSILPFGREYWRRMKPLVRWEKEIQIFCWDRLRELPTREEAEEICAWEGWHPVLRWHLEMFFGLKEQHLSP